MRVLIYKPTHIGDPDAQGRFGIHDCMGDIRNYQYDAVIGVGGVGREPQTYAIDRKINWVGIAPTKYKMRPRPGTSITFSLFRRWENQGPLLETLAPLLAERMYVKGARILLTGYTANEQKEAELILAWARRQRAVTFVRNGFAQSRGCQSRRKRC